VGEDGRGMVWPDDVPAEVPLSRQGQQSPQAGPSPMHAVEGAKKDSKPEKDIQGERAGPKPKRARKRPPLTAVPDGDATASKKAKSPRALRGEPAQAPSPRPVAAPPAPQRSPATRASRGRKRELPPYLRVVK